jgi:hypothetical protein
MGGGSMISATECPYRWRDFEAGIASNPNRSVAKPQQERETVSQLFLIEI